MPQQLPKSKSQVAPKFTDTDVRSVQSAAENVLATAISELKKAASEGKGKFFPNGIELIDVSVTVTGFVEVKLKIAGPRPPALNASSPISSEGV